MRYRIPHTGNYTCSWTGEWGSYYIEGTTVDLSNSDVMCAVDADITFGPESTNPCLYAVGDAPDNPAGHDIYPSPRPNNHVYTLPNGCSMVDTVSGSLFDTDHQTVSAGYIECKDDRVEVLKKELTELKSLYAIQQEELEIIKGLLNDRGII